jgi:hypothetical protein
LSKPIQADPPQRRARHQRRYDSALLVSSRSHEETLNLSIENNDFTVIFDTRLPITGAQEHCRFAEITVPQIATSADLRVKHRQTLEIACSFSNANCINRRTPGSNLTIVRMNRSFGRDA